MKSLKLFLLLFLLGCADNTFVSEDIPSIQDMTIASDLRGFNCEVDRIDKTTKLNWRGEEYYWDCKLKTYCKLQLFNEELRCFPEDNINYGGKNVYYLDDKCLMKLTYEAVVYNGGWDPKVPDNTMYIRVLGSTWAKVFVKDYGSITLHFIVNGVCKGRYSGGHPITYTLDPDMSKWVTDSDFKKIYIDW